MGLSSVVYILHKGFNVQVFFLGYEEQMNMYFFIVSESPPLNIFIEVFKHNVNPNNYRDTNLMCSMDQPVQTYCESQ